MGLKLEKRGFMYSVLEDYIVLNPFSGVIEIKLNLFFNVTSFTYVEKVSPGFN